MIRLITYSRMYLLFSFTKCCDILAKYSLFYGDFIIVYPDYVQNILKTFKRQAFKRQLWQNHRWTKWMTTKHRVIQQRESESENESTAFEWFDFVTCLLVV